MCGLQLHACASNARICSTAANAVSKGVWPTAACAASVLSICKSLCCTWTCLFSIFKDFCATPGVSVYKSFALHLDVSANKSAAQAVTVGVLLKFFLVCFGLFRNSSVCFGCFDISSKHRNKPKYLCFLFHETNRNKRETDLVSVCFGSNRNLFLFVSRTP